MFLLLPRLMPQEEESQPAVGMWGLTSLPCAGLRHSLLLVSRLIFFFSWTAAGLHVRINTSREAMKVWYAQVWVQTGDSSLLVVHLWGKQAGEDLVPWEPLLLLLLLLLLSWDGTPICLVSISPTQSWHHFSERPRAQCVQQRPTAWSCLDLEHLAPWR